MTLNAALRSRFGTPDAPQPLLGECGAGCSTTTGDPALPSFAIGGGNSSPLCVGTAANCN